jgi:hypothetical protein
MTGRLGATSFLGGPEWVGYVAFAIVLAVTGFAFLRYRHMQEKGDTRKANQLRVNIAFGLFLSVLVGLRAFVFHA